MNTNLIRLLKFAMMALAMVLLSACFESHYSDPYGYRPAYGYGYGPTYYEPAPVYSYAPEYVPRRRAAREEREEHEEHEEHEHHRPWHRDRD
jgi:hypothetical protein